MSIYKNNLLIILTVINFVICTKNTIKGVPESIVEFYTPATEFRCLDGLSAIPFTRLNDDYCDCQDGSDEPSTPACPNGIFHCRNTGYRSINIPSSRVNDGICDCCDASDENTTKCPQTCSELSDSLHYEEQKRVDFLKAGGEKRLEMIRKAREVKLEKTERYNELQKMKFKAEKVKISKEKVKKDAEYLEEIVLGGLENGKQKERTDDKIQSSNLDPETKAVLLAAMTARREYKQADQGLREIQLESALISSYFERDFGPDSEFQSLADRCFDITESEYIYKICLFDKVYQESKYGGSETILGEWGHWSEKYSQVVFENGAPCWNAPNRFAKVNFLCGLENQIVNVTEPSKCEYEFHFETPAVCYEFSEDGPEIEEHDEL